MRRLLGGLESADGLAPPGAVASADPGEAAGGRRPLRTVHWSADRDAGRGMPRPGLEPGTPRFSVVLARRSSSRSLQDILRSRGPPEASRFPRTLRLFPDVTADGDRRRP